jgi:hypothetical protein
VIKANIGDSLEDLVCLEKRLERLNLDEKTSEKVKQLFEKIKPPDKEKFKSYAIFNTLV